jgi:hypothetical protein
MSVPEPSDAGRSLRAVFALRRSARPGLQPRGVAACIALLLVLALSEPARAQSCDNALYSDRTKIEQWLSDAELVQTATNLPASWPAIASRLEAVQQKLGAEYAATKLAPLRPLEAFVAQVLASHDGSAASAHQTRVAKIAPQTCGLGEDDEPLCAWDLLDHAVQVPFEAAPPWTCEAKRRVANYTAALHHILAATLQPHFDAGSDKLGEYATAWQRLIVSGYSQYPWEVLLNGWFQKSDWGPTPYQFIAAHPALGLGVSGVGASDGQARTAAAVIAVEALGYLHYLRQFRHHVGLSAALTVPNLRGEEVGFGPVLHVDGFGLGYGVGLGGDHAQTVYILFDITRSIDDSMLLRNAGSVIRERL